MKTTKLTDEMRLSDANELTAAVQQIKIIRRLTENVEYARLSGDQFALQYQINSGLLGEIGDSLEILEEEIQRISNEICPD